jgi:hypothetical protein
VAGTVFLPALGRDGSSAVTRSILSGISQTRGHSFSPSPRYSFGPSEHQTMLLGLTAHPCVFTVDLPRSSVPAIAPV